MSATLNTVSEIGQIAVTVSDLARAKQFYHGILGLTFLFDAGPRLAFLAAGSVRIMLTLPERTGETGKNSTLYFKVADLTSTHEAMLAHGAISGGEPHLIARMPDHELWMSFLRDPDDNLVGLMEERRFKT